MAHSTTSPNAAIDLSSEDLSLIVPRDLAEGAGLLESVSNFPANFRSKIAKTLSRAQSVLEILISGELDSHKTPTKWNDLNERRALFSIALPGIEMPNIKSWFSHKTLSERMVMYEQALQGNVGLFGRALVYEHQMLRPEGVTGEAFVQKLLERPTQALCGALLSIYAKGRNSPDLKNGLEALSERAHDHPLHKLFFSLLVGIDLLRERPQSEVSGDASHHDSFVDLTTLTVKKLYQASKHVEEIDLGVRLQNSCHSILQHIDALDDQAFAEFATSIVENRENGPIKPNGNLIEEFVRGRERRIVSNPVLFEAFLNADPNFAVNSILSKIPKGDFNQVLISPYLDYAITHYLDNPKRGRAAFRILMTASLNDPEDAFPLMHVLLNKTLIPQLRSTIATSQRRAEFTGAMCDVIHDCSQLADSHHGKSSEELQKITLIITPKELLRLFGGKELPDDVKRLCYSISALHQGDVKSYEKLIDGVEEYIENQIQSDDLTSVRIDEIGKAYEVLEILLRKAPHALLHADPPLACIDRFNSMLSLIPLSGRTDAAVQSNNARFAKMFQNLSQTSSYWAEVLSNHVDREYLHEVVRIETCPEETKYALHEMQREIDARYESLAKWVAQQFGAHTRKIISSIQNNLTARENALIQDKEFWKERDQLTNEVMQEVVSIMEELLFLQIPHGQKGEISQVQVHNRERAAADLFRLYRDSPDFLLAVKASDLIGMNKNRLMYELSGEDADAFFGLYFS